MKNTIKSSKDHQSNNVENPSKSCYDRRCENCIAFRVLEGPQDSSKELLGECRYEPPKIIPSDDDGYPLSIWPIVTTNGWCTKHVLNNAVI